MPPEGPRSIVEELVTIAGRDLRAAELLAGEPELVHAVCFHGQQAVEKMLKAALLAASVDPPRTHDLVVAPRYPGWESGSGEVSPREAVVSARTGFALLLPLTTAVPT